MLYKITGHIDEGGSFVSDYYMYIFYYPHGKTEEEYAVPEKVDGAAVTVVGEGLFEEAPLYLKSIFLSDSITWLQERCFEDWDASTNVTMLKNIEVIDYSAMRGCGMTTVVIPASVRAIDRSAFMDCENLTNLVIERREWEGSEQSEYYMNAGVFQGCDRLKNVYFAGTSDEWEELKSHIDWEPDLEDEDDPEDDRDNDALKNANVICLADMAGDTDDIDAAAEDIVSLDEGYMERNHVEVNHNYDDSETASVTSFTLSDTAELSSDTEGISVTGVAHNAKPNDKVTVTVGGWYSEHEAGAESVNFSLDIDGAEQVVTGEDGKEFVFPLLAEVPKPAWASNYSSFKVVFFDSDGEEEELVSSAGGDAIYFVTDSVGDFSISGKDLSSKSGSLKNVLSEEEKKLLEDSNASSTSKNEVLKKISQQIAKNVEDVSGNSVQLTDTAVMGRKGL